HTRWPRDWSSDVCSSDLGDWSMSITLSKPGDHDAVEGIDCFDKVIDIDQSPIGRTPRSNPATYTDLFTPIRELYSLTPEAKVREIGRASCRERVEGRRAH